MVKESFITLQCIGASVQRPVYIAMFPDWLRKLRKVRLCTILMADVRPLLGRVLLLQPSSNLPIEEEVSQEGATSLGRGFLEDFRKCQKNRGSGETATSKAGLAFGRRHAI